MPSRYLFPGGRNFFTIASMGKPFFKTIRIIDLTTEHWKDQEVETELFEHFLGGSGIAASLFKRFPEARCIITAGPLSASSLPFSGGWSILFRSEQGELLESSGGGSIGRALDGCGLEAIILTGRARERCFLDICQDQVDFHSLPRDYPFSDPIEGAAYLISNGKVRDDSHSGLLTLGQAAWDESPGSTIFHQHSPLPANGGIGARLGAMKIAALALHPGSTGRGRAAQRYRAPARGGETVSQFTLPAHPVRERTAFLIHCLLSSLPVKVRTDDHLSLPLMRTFGSAGLSLINNRKEGKLILRGLEFRRLDNNEKRKTLTPWNMLLATGGPYGETVLPSLKTLSTALEDLSLFSVPEILLFQECAIRKGLAPEAAARFLGSGNEAIKLQGNIDAILAALKEPMGTESSQNPAGKKPLGQKPLGRFLSGQDPLEALFPYIDTAAFRSTPVSLHTYHASELWKCVPALPRPAILYHRKEDSWIEKEKAIMAKAMVERLHLILAAGLPGEVLFLSERRFPLFSLLNSFTGWERTPRGYMDMARAIIDQRKSIFPCSPSPPKEGEVHELLTLYNSLDQGA